MRKAGTKHTFSVGECRKSPLYSDHKVEILWAGRRKNGVLDLTRRSGEISSANLARKRRDWDVGSTPDIQSYIVTWSCTATVAFNVDQPFLTFMSI